MSTLLRHNRFIADHRNAGIYPEISMLLIRDAKLACVPWFDKLMSVFLDNVILEHSIMNIFGKDGPQEVYGEPVYARESLILSEPRISTCFQKWNQETLKNILLHSTSTALSDELSNLTVFEKRELARTLQLAWDREIIGTGRTAFRPGLNLIWSVGDDETKAIQATFLNRQKPTPMLLLQSTGNQNMVPDAVLTALTPIIDQLWNIGLASQHRVNTTPEEEKLILDWLITVRAEISSIKNPLARKLLHWLPESVYRVFALYRLFTEEETIETAKAAIHTTAALAQKHYEALRTITADFTADHSEHTDTTDETIAEYMLLAKIEKNSPVTRSELNRLYSNKQRKLLDQRLSRLLRDGRIAIDDKARFSVRSLVSVYE